MKQVYQQDQDQYVPDSVCSQHKLGQHIFITMTVELNNRQQSKFLRLVLTNRADTGPTHVPSHTDPAALFFLL